MEETISDAGRTSLFKLGGFGVVLQRQFTDRFFHARYELTKATRSSNMLVPEAVFLLVSTKDRYLWAGLRDSRTFRQI